MIKEIVTIPPLAPVDDAGPRSDIERMDATRLLPNRRRRGPALRTLLWLGAATAGAVAAVVAALFALFLAGAVVLLALVGSILALVTGLAMQARRTARAPVRSGGDVLIEARQVGGTWAPYRWDERAR